MKKIKINFSKYVADDRRQIAGLLTDAIDKLIEPEEDFNDAIRRISEHYENMTGYYPVVSLHKDDMRDAGFNPDRLTGDEMRNFACSMPKDSMMDSYRVSMEYHAENDFNLPELRTEIDSIYAAYKEASGREPLYAQIWLEDKGYNNQPWPVTVKLSLYVDEQEDEHIYMSFFGFDELKKWLFSLENDKNSDEDWCYDTPEQRIVFMDKLFVDEI